MTWLWDKGKRVLIVSFRVPVRPSTLLTLWIVIFSALVIWLVLGNRSTASANKKTITKLAKTTARLSSATKDLKTTKANIKALEVTNCGLKRFLLQAEVARINAANHENDGQAEADAAAAKGYNRLANSIIAVGVCRLDLVIPPIETVRG